MTQAHIIITIDTENPIEIGDFVSAFTSVANQFDKFIATNHPEISGDARIFVKEVSKGSIIADLIPLAPMFGIPAGAVVYLQHADVVADFVLKYGEKLTAYFKPGGKIDTVTDSDLKDFMGSVSAIAKDTNGKSSIEAAYFENEHKRIKAAVIFTTPEARAAVENIEQHRLRLRSADHTSHDRVLMVFMQSNIKNTTKRETIGREGRN